MSIDNLVAWYEINVGQRLTLSFVNYLIKICIINSDVDLDVLNGYLLEKNGYEYVKENGLYKIKKNRLPIIEKVTKTQNIESSKKEPEKKTPKIINNKPISSNTRYKIKMIDGAKLKLIKT